MLRQVATVAATLWALTSFAGRAAANEPQPHELGWLCLNVSDTNITQVSGFNRDAPSLSIWVTKSRFHIDATGPGSAGRICIPTVVRVGDGPLPPETLVFERNVISGEVHRAATAELVLTPASPRLSEATVQLVGLDERWTLRDGTLTFQARHTVTFPERVTRGLLGDGEGPPAPEVFRGFVAAQNFTEPCQPAVLEEASVASHGHFDARSGQVTARGIEPYRLDAGTEVSRCEGLALDTMMVAVARPASDAPDETAIRWYLIPRTTRLKLLDAGPQTSRYSPRKPLGGYHVCRQPSWTTGVLRDIPLLGTWELKPNGEWDEIVPGDVAATSTIAAGANATLLDYRDTWALVAVRVDAALRIVAVPASAVAMPSGPAQDAIELDGGLCSVARGQWKAVAANAQTFRVSQDTPGDELAGLWLEIPMGTQVLQMCQDGADNAGKTTPGVPACAPIFVGGTQGDGSERFILVRYAGMLLAVRQRDLRDKITGEFELRRARPYFHRAGGVHQDPRGDDWALSLGPGARVSFVRPDDHAWTIMTYVQRLSDHRFAFEGGVGAGVDGRSPFITLVGGVGSLIHRFDDLALELRGGVLGQLDVRVGAGGGLAFDVIGKLQLRWVNDYAPVSFELGLDLGYGGTFGEEGKGGLRLGMPITLRVELLRF